MPKIAFIIEPQFLEHHWGVRVYLYSLAKVLSNTVDRRIRLSQSRTPVNCDGSSSTCGTSRCFPPRRRLLRLPRRSVEGASGGRIRGRPPADGYYADSKPPSAGIRRPAVMPLARRSRSNTTMRR